MVEFLKKIELVQDESIRGDFHSMHVAVQVDLVDGTNHTAVCRAARLPGVLAWRRVSMRISCATA